VLYMSILTDHSSFHLPYGLVVHILSFKVY
jgi:hypothetical protein